MPTRLSSLLLVLSLACPLFARNVLLITSDNQNWDDVGCYGNSVIQTPVLDQMAKEGTRYEFAFATTASCGPSRGVLYSGLHVHSNGQYGHPHSFHNFRMLPGVKTVFETLHEAGVMTGLIGKGHIHPPEGTIEFNPRISPRDVVKLAKAAGEMFSKAKDRPFFLAIGYSDPHPTGRDHPGWGIIKHDPLVKTINYKPEDVIVPTYLPDRPEVREGIAGYYQQISRLDQGIGMVIDALRESGKLDDTLIIFASDHGSSEPGAMSNHYEPGVRIPFIVREPSGKGRGEVNRSMVTLCDVTPTSLAFLGVKSGKPLQGRNILSTLGKPEGKGWDEVYLSHVFHEVTMYYPMRTLRTRTHKLIWNLNWQQPYVLPIDTLNRKTWKEVVRRKDKMIGPRTVEQFLHRPEIELYDLQSDPDEINNLASDPVHAAVRADLLAKLAKFCEQTKDQWLTRHTMPK